MLLLGETLTCALVLLVALGPRSVAGRGQILVRAVFLAVGLTIFTDLALRVLGQAPLVA